MRNITVLIFLFLFMFCSAASLKATAGTIATVPDYTLTVSFDIPHSKVMGIAKITVSEDKEIVLDVSHLSILSVIFEGRENSFSRDGGTMRIKTGKRGVLEIQYEGVFDTSRLSNAAAGMREMVDNVISEKGIFLTGIWYPRPHGLMRYRLSAVLPNGYQALSEAERIDSAANDGIKEFTFHFDHPSEHLTFAASNRFRVIKDSYDKIDLYAYFFDEDVDLAKEYLEYAKKYLGLYQKMLTPYPYSRFSIVENISPSGYSMPTFTLLGQAVVKLPFIVRTSLGHEILHQWFGNSVYINYAKGNWAEGLTTYMADYFYAEQEGEGTDYRKQILIDYQSYVNKDNVFPLSEFMGRTDFSSKAIGYDKAAMVFHMLESYIGKDVFRQALRHFITANAFRQASWSDLQSSVETTSGIGLADFFDQWLNRTTVPELVAGIATVRQKGEGYELSFDLRQKTTPFNMLVPVSIYALGKREIIPLKISKELEPVRLYSRELPERIVIDEGYDVMRSLSPEEFPAVIARLLGDTNPILILSPSEGNKYQEIIKTFGRMGASIEKPADVNDALLAKYSFIILGADNPMIKRFGNALAKDVISGGFTAHVSKNTFNPNKVVAIFNAESTEEAVAAFPKIFHYGKYSRLVFKNGKNILKETDASQMGLTVGMDAEEPAVHVPDLAGLSQVIKAVRDKRIIYVGENHDNFADHTVQLEFIKELSSSGVQMAIGMEMFQKPFQSVLDDYIKGIIDQGTFLKKTEYFKRWKLDYDLYKPILEYARDNRIPVVALNIENDIVDKVSKNGIEGLQSDYKEKIPHTMDFSDAQYRERLEKVFREHPNFKELNFDFFNQAQIIWDEYMSQSIADYLSSHPDRRMVVLAGNGHLMYGSGIPKRTARRNGLSYAIVLNSAELEKGIADYIVFPRNIEGPKPVRMMVLLKEEKGQVRIAGFPENSISQKAGLKEGDIILSIGDTLISSIDDVKIYLLEKHNGEKITVKILRGVGLTAKDMQFEITL